MMQELLNDNPAPWAQALHVLAPGVIVASMSGAMPGIAKRRQGSLAVAGQRPALLAEGQRDQIRKVEVVTACVLDLGRDALGLECFDHGDLEESPHHDRAGVVPALREAPVHLSSNGHEVAPACLAQDA